MTITSQSTLIELPPETRTSGDFAAQQYPEISTPQELSEAVDHLSQSLLDRALYKGDMFTNYYIRGFIAAGGMGEIYVAQRLNQEQKRSRPLALKVLNNEQATRRDVLLALGREARLCQAVHSRHVVRIYEYGLSDTGRGFISMELLIGEELYDRMARQKVIPIKQLATLAIEILDGLHDIHQMGIVHRDLKPENIYLAKSRRWGEIAKILDFGLAKRHGEPDPLEHSTDLVGTPNYMAPEQTQSPRVDHRADLYSLGVILYQCAVGDAPFERDTPYATLMAHQEDPVPLLPSTLDYQFCEIIQKALNKNPADRWQTAMEMRMALDAWLADTSWDDAFPGEASFSLDDTFSPEDSGVHLPQPQSSGITKLPPEVLSTGLGAKRSPFHAHNPPPPPLPTAPDPPRPPARPPRAQIHTLQGAASPLKEFDVPPPPLDELAADKKLAAPRPHLIQPLDQRQADRSAWVGQAVTVAVLTLLAIAIAVVLYFKVAS